MNYDPKMNILSIKDQLEEDYKLKVSSNLQVGEADNAADNPVFVQITNPSDIEATLAEETTKVIGTVNDKIADGDDISLGAKADAAATSGDITPFSVISLLKGIWNKLGSVVLTTSSAVVGKVGIDQTTDGVTNRVNAKMLVTGKTASDTITRGNVTTPYTAGDVVSTEAGEIMEFPSVGTANEMLVILGARLRIDLDAAVAAGITGYRLHLYNAAPTAIADNAPYNLPAADRAKYLGYITISTPIRLDDTQYAQDDNINYTCIPTGTSLYGILQTIGAYTPTANAVKTIILNAASV